MGDGFRLRARLLLLEDSALDAELTLSQLGEAFDLEVDHVSTEHEFRLALISRDYDVILADYSLPDFDGMRALRIAQEITPTTPFIFVSGTMGEEIATNALRLGAADYVFKSQLEKLVPSMQRAVREKHNFNQRIHSEQELQRISEALRQNQKMVTIGRMAAMIAHETNNPLESVINLLFLLRDEVKTDAGQRYLAAAERELSRVIEVTHQTLKFYREATSPVNVQVEELLDEVLRLFRRRITMKEITLRKDVLPCKPLLAMPGEIRQIMTNLLANAIDATPRGGRLRVRLRESHSRTGDKQAGVRLVIGDNGCGIPQASLRRLGDAFFTTKGQDGTGLGMWVTRGIVRKYSGRMHVCSATRDNRHGTVVSIFIPYLPVTNLQKAKMNAGGREASGTMTSD